jgi:hypothetical protein
MGTVDRCYWKHGKSRYKHENYVFTLKSEANSGKRVCISRVRTHAQDADTELLLESSEIKIILEDKNLDRYMCGI